MNYFRKMYIMEKLQNVYHIMITNLFPRSKNNFLLKTFFLVIFLTSFQSLLAQSGITSIDAAYTDVDDATNDFSNTGNGTNGAYANGTTYNLSFSTTTTTNNDYLINSGFNVGATTYNTVALVDIFFVRRNGLTDGNANRQIIWFETESVTGTDVNLNPTYTPSVEESFRSFRLNIGSDNTFVNTGSPQSNNIERFDYVNSRALTTATPNNAGFAVFERNGNDPFKIAAITAIDGAGNATAFGTLLNVTTASYGPSLKPVDYVIFQKQDADANLKPAENGGTQNVTGIFFSFTDLGIAANQTVYGYVILPDDAISTDYTLNPTNTASAAGGMDTFPGGGFFDSDGGLVFIFPEIIANNDDYTSTPYLSGIGGTTPSVFSNDTLDDIAFLDTDVVPSILDNDGISGLAINADGTISIPSGTTPGSYTVQYQICDVNNTASCDTANVLIVVSPGPSDLSLTKTIDNATPSSGDTVTFTLVLTNSGPASTTGVQVEDILPSGLVYDSGNSTIPVGTTYNNVSGIWDLSTLTINNGDTFTLQIVATVTPACGEITNTAEIISSNSGDSDSTINNGN